MRKAEALTLKEGDLVVINSNRNNHYGGLVLEIESIKQEDYIWCCHVTLKQPGFDVGFRIRDYDTRLLQRYEA